MILSYDLIQNISSIAQRLHRNIPQKELWRISSMAASFLDSESNPQDKMSVITVILDLPEVERKEIVELVKSILSVQGDQTSYGHEALKLVAKIPKEERKEWIKDAQELVKNIQLWERKKPILEVLLSFQLPRQQRKELIKDVLSVLPSMLDPDQFLKTFKAIGGIPEHQRSELLNDAKPLLELENNDKGSIISALLDIPQNERRNIVEYALPVSMGSNSATATILKAVHKIPESQRPDVVASCLPFLKDCSAYEKAGILEAVSKIPSGERKHVLLQAARIQTKIPAPLHRKTILDSLIQIPLDQREALIDQLIHHLSHEDAKHLTDLLLSMNQIPQEHREKLLQEAVPLLRHQQDKKLKLILPFLLHFDHQSWKTIIEASKPITAFLDQGLPEKLTIDTIQSALDQNLLDEATSSKILQVLVYAPPEFHEQIYMFLTAHPEIVNRIPIETLKIIIRQKPAIKEDLLRFLIQLLTPQENEGILKWSRDLANQLAQTWTDLDANNDIEGQLILAIIDAQSYDRNSQDRRHPFVLHKKLRNLANTPTPTVSQPDHQGYILDLTSIKDSKLDLSNVPSYTIRDLQQTVFQSRTEIARSNQARLLADTIVPPDPTDPQVSTDSNTLLDNYKDSFFETLLSRPREHLNRAKFCAILRFIKDQPSDTSETKLISLQTESLLRISSAIRNCPTGKERGIDEVYKNLQEQYKYPLLGSQGINLDELSNDEKFLRTLVVQVIYDLLDALFSDQSDMVKEMLGRPTDPQMVHQVQYIRNLLAPHVGLIHEYAYDRHSRCIDPQLEEKDLPTMLRIFFSHFNLEKLIDQVKSKFDPAILESDRTPVGVVNVGNAYVTITERVSEELSTLFNLSSLSASNRTIKLQENSFEWDEDYTERTITREGVLALLIGLKIFKQNNQERDS
jgi:hypothetical protein